jgi:DNA polymerase elongation subunit (family B)
MILGKLFSENTLVCITRKSSASAGIEGAYVHTPKPGFVGWGISIDAAALYPNIAIGLNMSPETMVGMNPECSVLSLLNSADFSNQEFSIAANGSMYSKDFQGIIPRLMEELGQERNASKKEMLVAKNKLITLEAEMKKRGI